MIKNLLFIFFFFTFSMVFSQEKSIENLNAAPNPFSNYTIISFYLENDAKTTLTIKNILGKVVYQKTLETSKGMNNIPFLKGDLTQGIYIYTIQNKENSISKRMVIQ